MDGGGFEPPKRVATDLQSAPFGHSGIHPNALTSIDYIIINLLKNQVLFLYTQDKRMNCFLSSLFKISCF